MHPSRPGLHKAPLVLALAVLIAGPISAIPPSSISSVLVIAKPGTTPGEIFNGIMTASSRIVWSDR
ncbi:MAG TPA: hypothetical protein VHJ19_06600 [Gammaproteobacteria bacterium]|nr:hypothetical protein [Gammaproteobacteria bacterium]